MDLKETDPTDTCTSNNDRSQRNRCNTDKFNRHWFNTETSLTKSCPTDQPKWDISNRTDLTETGPVETGLTVTSQTETGTTDKVQQRMVSQ